jgi:Tol biopolymer transport system component
MKTIGRICHMNSMKRSVIALSFITSTSFAPVVTASDQADVTLFAPGAIPTAATNSMAPAFTPDGASVYLGQISSNPKNVSIMSSQKIGKEWSVPKLAPFSGQYRDLEPAFAPSGKYLVFASSRPAGPGEPELDGHYNGQIFPGDGGKLWKVERTKQGWSAPEALPSVINSNSSVFTPSIAADGSLYFMRADNGGSFHIYRSQMRNGKFEAPILVSFGDATIPNFDPMVAPDESYIIFSSRRPPFPNTTDLFIAFRTATGWGDPIDLRSALSDNVHGIEARLSPDGKTLYFSNSRSSSGADIPDARFIWQVDLSNLLQAHSAGKTRTQ